MQNEEPAGATMSQRLRFSTARDLFEAFPTASERHRRPPADRPSLDFMAELVAGPTPEDGITFCAYLLPKREAVWWAHECLAGVGRIAVARGPSNAGAGRGLGALSRRRRSATPFLMPAWPAPTKTPGVWVALAAGWSGGSMLPPDIAAGRAASISDGQGRQCRRAQRAGPRRPQVARRDAQAVRQHGNAAPARAPERIVAAPHCLQCIGAGR